LIDWNINFCMSCRPSCQTIKAASGCLLLRATLEMDFARNFGH
jgi:hypothetical protein